ncbi:thiamine pyrophosphokinase, catalytic domain-containing protein [Cardiosporidium cionae]|uniref:Thiamine pyrophosphokinase, catalytic domain-containing protein n=1 Tax=Cardiosporidium cionae TaxID=476202 RepID=A0ABQ7JBG3_9APIC|nr:thiamine pyrophosphokinase, catalytic domain-containing protein [Cardiosporidium cionae]|eukprot:KAF8821298.1 thiamine pyrophosphokinase, catalytic domain-containing protein [Cardiosporidium cionae]
MTIVCFSFFPVASASFSVGFRTLHLSGMKLNRVGLKALPSWEYLSKHVNRYNPVNLGVTLCNRLKTPYLHDLRFFGKMCDSAFTEYPQGIPRFHVILLNWPLDSLAVKFLSLADVVLCADGAANNLFPFHSKAKTALAKLRLPSYICGDFDSVAPHVLKYYKSLGVPIIHNPCQDTTDTTKCWQKLQPRLLSGDKVILLGGIGGRFDHSVSNIGFLFKMLKQDNLLPIQGRLEVFVIGENNLCFLLPPGRNIVRFPTNFTTKYCGLLPLGGSCRWVTTSGLRWNMYRQKLDMSVLISSSNEISHDVVTVENTDPVLWFSEIRKPTNFPIQP